MSVFLGMSAPAPSSPFPLVSSLSAWDLIPCAPPPPSSLRRATLPRAASSTYREPLRERGRRLLVYAWVDGQDTLRKKNKSVPCSLSHSLARDPVLSGVCPFPSTYLPTYLPGSVYGMVWYGMPCARNGTRGFPPPPFFFLFRFQLRQLGSSEASVCKLRICLLTPFFVDVGCGM